MSNAHTDEELAQMAQGEGATAREAETELVARYQKLVSMIASDFALRGVDREDRFSMGLLGLLKAIRAWRPEKGSKFKTFARLTITSGMIDMSRAEGKASRVPNAVTVHMDDDDAGISEVIAGTDDTYAEVETRLTAEAAHIAAEAAQLGVVMDAALMEHPACRQAGGVILEAVRRFAAHRVLGGAMSLEVYADLIEVLDVDVDQLKLFRLGPAKGSPRARSLAREVFAEFASIQYLVLVDHAAGYTDGQIAVRCEIDVDVVIAMLASARAAGQASTALIDAAITYEGACAGLAN